MAIPRTLSKTALAATMAAVYGMAYVPALEAGPTSIHNEPLSTGQPSVPPNIMFILDDSGSMQWDFMPDEASVLNRRMFGRSAAQCNGLAYDPAQF